MNRAQKLGFAVMAISAVAPIVIEYVTHQYMMRTTKTIDPEVLKEQQADRYASAIVRETIHHGDGYQDRRIAPDEDFEFYRLAYHFTN